MDVVERGHFLMKMVSQHWHILLTFFLDHLNGRTRSRKVGPQGLLIDEEDATMVA
jgi:hypothetical protein